MAKRRRKGEGTLWLDKRNGRWMAQITLPTGKRRTRSGKNEKEVLDWLTEQRSKIKKGTPDHLQKFYTLKLEEGLSKRTVQYSHMFI